MKEATTILFSGSSSYCAAAVTTDVATADVDSAMATTAACGLSYFSSAAVTTASVANLHLP